MRDVEPVFAATLYRTVLLPVTEAGDVIIIQLTLAAADHEHSGFDDVTPTLPLPPLYV